MVNNLITPFSLACLAIAVAAVIANFVLLATRYSGLPDQVPVHYGLFGRPDRWGHKSIMWLLALLPLVMLLLMAMPMANMVTRTKGKSDIGEVRSTFRLLATMIAYISVGACVITARMLAVAEKETDGLGRMVGPLFLGGLIIITVLFLLPL